ncbi:ABC transporter ATP-binding protein [Numidum massiliense]|uniref:ABC transporter ATP-binding protein n=1 Tax=Numidum massiliense TaxID=1522315 RepID=UPI0036F2929C
MTYKALDKFSLAIDEGEFVGVMGPSGSGKTTLLNILATIDQPTSGELHINGVNPNDLKNRDLALFRRRQLGFIFQDFNLLDTLTLKENIILPLVLDKAGAKAIEARVHDIASLLNIEHLLDKRTYEVSGGQQQRAAAARALIHDPAILLADEPTGNLDSKAANNLMQSLAQLNEQKGSTIMMVTHDPFAASFCERIVFIKDGQYTEELRRRSDRNVFLQHILDALSRLGGTSDDVSAARL